MRPGLQALMENAGVAGKPVTADTVSYSLAPRLNAAGRMDNAAVALKLLLCTDEAQAAGIAARLAEINTERQQTEQEVFAAAQKDAGSRPCPPAGPRTGGLRRGLAPRCYRYCGRAADGKIQPPRHRHLAAKWRDAAAAVRPTRSTCTVRWLAAPNT